MIALKKIYNSPYTVLVTMLLGIVFGLNFKEFAHHYSILGKIYLDFLRVAVIPLVICIIVRGVFHINSAPKNLVIKSFSFCFIITLCSVIMSVIVTLFLKPWSHIKDLSGFNSLFASSTNTKPLEMLIDHDFGDTPSPSILDFLLHSIPANFFGSLTASNMLQIVFGSAFLGVGFYIAAKKANSIKSVSSKVDYVNEVFSSINDVIISVMPIGVFFLMSNLFADIDISVLNTIGSLAANMIICLLIQISAYLFIIWYKSGVSLWLFLRTFSDTFLLLVTTSSSIVCLPSAMKNMKKLGFSEDGIDVYMPFGVPLIRLGTMSFFAIVSLYIMGIFQVEPTFEKCIFIVFASVFAAISTVGAADIIALQMIAIILEPLGLPLGGVIAIMVAIAPITEIFETIANLIGNSAVVALAGHAEQEAR